MQTDNQSKSEIECPLVTGPVHNHFGHDKVGAWITFTVVILILFSSMYNLLIFWKKSKISSTQTPKK